MSTILSHTVISLSLIVTKSCPFEQIDQKIKKLPNSSKNSPKVAKSKKAKNIYNKAQFESPKHLQQNHF
jgi:hypothetical protein